MYDKKDKEDTPEDQALGKLRVSRSGCMEGETIDRIMMHPRPARQNVL